MWRDKPAGVKILWIWTIGTAAILLTSSVRNRLKEMEKIIKNSEQPVDSAVVIDSGSSSNEAIREDKSYQVSESS